MNTTIDVVGVYAVAGEPNVHLVELIVRYCEGIFDLGAFTQEEAGLPESDWQVAYDEQVLDLNGTKILSGDLSRKGETDIWTGDVRLVFFFHFLNLSRPLKTPFGDVSLPQPTAMPERLSTIRYEPPC